MNKTFDQTTLRLKTWDCDDDGSHVCLVFDHPDGDPVLQVEQAVGEPVDLANRVAGCVNACLGLALPENVTPGILAEIVKQARGLIAARKRAQIPAQNYREGIARRAAVDAGKAAIEALALTLEKLEIR